MIAVPPPNVTGALHMGHALNGALQDVLVRWHRMRGFDTLWQPGYDHAGISTQNVVEKQLVAEGTSRKAIGREAFVARVWQHLEETGRTIMGQYRRLGASLAYDRERFTMDDAYVEAVMRFFVHCWERGWLYRANRIVNWCPFHETAISDLEVVHEPMDDMLTHARYPFADGSGTITIATVRPPTILADVAVAVHPEDERYRDAVGREVVDTTKDVARGTKNVSKKVYRKGAVVGNRVWTGTKWVARSSWKGGTWVAVKTKNGTKWVYRKGRNVVRAARRPVS